MSYQEERLTEIANAIRAKKGTSDKILAKDFATEITNLTTGAEPILKPRDVVGQWLFGVLPQGYVLLDFKDNGEFSMLIYGVPETISGTYTIEGSKINAVMDGVSQSILYDYEQDALYFEDATDQMYVWVEGTLRDKDLIGDWNSSYGNSFSFKDNGVVTITNQGASNDYPYIRIGNNVIVENGNPPNQFIYDETRDVLYMSILADFILTKVVCAGGSKFGELVEGSITTIEGSDLADVTTIRDDVFANLEITKVEIPSNVTEIGASAFANNEISSLTLNEGVTTIGDSAFANNPITTLTIPSTVTSIGISAFDGTQITELDMSNVHTPPTVDATSFPSTLTAIHVAYGDYDAYLTAWSSYADKIVRLPAIPSTITVTVNNYLGEMVSGASVTITGNGQTYTGTTDSVGVFSQGNLQPATYTISVADLEGFKTPDVQEVVVEEDTQNSVIVTYLEKPTIILFSEATPAEISAIGTEISNAGMTSAEVEATYGWKIGDTTSYTLSTGEQVEMRIIGFNHDTLSDGSGKKAGITLEMTGLLNNKFLMNNEQSTVGGFPASSMNTSTLPTIKTTMPQEWQDIIVKVDKQSANGGGSVYERVVTDSHELFILSIMEYTGTKAHSVEEGSVYEYWSDKTASDRKRSSNYWTRSTYFSGTAVDNRISYCLITTVTYIENGVGSSWANEQNSLSYAFCVGGGTSGGDSI